MLLTLHSTTKDPHFVDRKTCAAALAVLALDPEARKEYRPDMERIRKYGTPDAPALWKLKQGGIDSLMSARHKGKHWFEESSGDDIVAWARITVEAVEVEVEPSKATKWRSVEVVKRVVGLDLSRAHLNAEKIAKLVPGLNMLSGLHPSPCSIISELQSRLQSLDLSGSLLG